MPSKDELSLAIDAIFDEHKARITPHGLVQLIISKLNLNLSKWKQENLSESILQYIRSNPEYKIIPGKAGGIEHD